VSSERLSSARRLALFALLFSALLALALAGPGSRAVAQETDLPGVSADSIDEDFLKGSVPPEIEAPAVPGVPAPPRPPDDPRTEAFRRRIHAGDNDVVQVGQDVVVERGEHVLGHVFAMGGNITIKGVVDDDVVAMGGDVTLEDGAMVRGDIVSLGGTVHKAKTATVLGSNVTVGGLPRGFFDFRTLDWFGNGMRFLQALMNLALWLILGWVVVMATPDRSRRILATIESQPALSVLWGFLGILALLPLTVAVALAAVLLVVTIIGIPVAVLLLLGYVLAIACVMVWGGVLGASALGEWLVRRLYPRLGEPALVRNTLVGVVALSLLGLVGPLFRAMGIALPPAALLGTLLLVLGKAIQSAAMLAGIGGVLRARAGQVEPLRMPWGGGSRVVSAPTPPPAPPTAPATPL
jgi:hypothetical protein